jgi:hypothetical protein
MKQNARLKRRRRSFGLERMARQKHEAAQQPLKKLCEFLEPPPQVGGFSFLAWVLAQAAQVAGGVTWAGWLNR